MDAGQRHPARLAKFPAGLLGEQFPRFALRQKAKVGRCRDVAHMLGAESFQDLPMFFRLGQVVQVLRVGLAVVEFLDCASGAGEVPLGGGHRFALGQAIKVVANFAVVGPGGGLVVAEVRHVVANVQVAAIAHGAGEVAHFIDSIAVAVDVPARRGDLEPEERFALHIFGDGDAGEAEDGGRVVHKTHEAVDGGAGFAGGEVLPFFRETNQERHVHAAVQQRTLVAGHATAVVAVKKDDRVFREAVVLELLQDGAHLLVHRRDAIVKARDLATDERRVRIIRRQRHLARIMNLAGG